MFLLGVIMSRCRGSGHAPEFLEGRHPQVLRWPLDMRWLVVPELKFAFCIIPKVACTQFARLINKLNWLLSEDMHACLHKPEEKFGENGTRYAAYVCSSTTTRNVNIRDITPSSGWRTAAFYREPMARFHSAWRNKCVEWELQGIDCLSSEWAWDWWPDLVAHFEHAVFVHLPAYEALRNRSGGMVNNHYDFQATHCGMEWWPGPFNYTGLLTDHADVHAQVAQMLTDVAGVPPDLYAKLDVGGLFPSAPVAGQNRKKTPSFKESYRNPAVWEKVFQAYKVDNDMYAGLLETRWRKGGEGTKGGRRPVKRAEPRSEL